MRVVTWPSVWPLLIVSLRRRLPVRNRIASASCRVFFSEFRVRTSIGSVKSSIEPSRLGVFTRLSRLAVSSGIPNQLSRLASSDDVLRTRAFRLSRNSRSFDEWYRACYLALRNIEKSIEGLSQWINPKRQVIIYLRYLYYSHYDTTCVRYEDV